MCFRLTDLTDVIYQAMKSDVFVVAVRSVVLLLLITVMWEAGAPLSL